eukprot:1166180-Rhodomonas_salina.1
MQRVCRGCAEGVQRVWRGCGEGVTRGGGWGQAGVRRLARLLRSPTITSTTITSTTSRRRSHTAPDKPKSN